MIVPRMIPCTIRAFHEDTGIRHSHLLFVQARVGDPAHADMSDEKLIVLLKQFASMAGVVDEDGVVDFGAMNIKQIADAINRKLDIAITMVIVTPEFMGHGEISEG